MKGFSYALLPLCAVGHSQLYEPPSRGSGGIAVGQPNCAGGGCLFFNNGAFIGCPEVTGGWWNASLCPKGTIEPTIPFGDKQYGTIFMSDDYCSKFPADCEENPAEFKMWETDVKSRVPWRAPGSAPVGNACGLSGGGVIEGPHGTGGVAFFGRAQGWKGTEVPPLLKTTTWIAGSVVEVAFGLTANHGGGYQYRLCRLNHNSDNITSQVTEECFQQTPLKFHGDKQWIQWGNGLDVNNRTEINAVRVNKGVFPEGHAWTRNPIPPCNDVPRTGGHNHKCLGPMFEPPAPGLWGFGPGSCASGVAPCTAEEMKERAFPFGIVDHVRIPKHLPEGEYVLGFRWDCEQLPQVWANCADVTIKKKKHAKPTKPFSSWSGCEQCCANTFGPCANCTKCLNDKTGDCAKCWSPQPGYTFGAMPQYQCLGYEGPDGGPGIWEVGMPFIGKKWSPGCPKCWKTPGSCERSPRESVDDTEVLV